jgi:hypothetical protein
MEKDLRPEATQENAMVVTPPVEPEDECGTVCYHPECACRERTIAGCSLPLATTPTIQIERRTQNSTREKL